MYGEGGLRARIAPLSVALIWGVNVPVMKAALGYLHPFTFNALRLTLSALALGIADWLERRASGATLPRPTPWAAVVGLGLLTSLLYQLLFVQGMARTSASHAGFLIASGPLWTAAIARALGVERPGGRAWAGLAVAFLGTCLVAAAKDPGAQGGGVSPLFGNAILLAAMIVWALATVLARPVMARISATRLAFLYTCVALPGHWLLATPQLARASEPIAPSLWLAVVYSGVMSTGIAYALWNRSVLHIGPARTAAYSNLVPLVALVIAWATLGERPGVLQITGGALVCIGIGFWRSTRAAVA